MPFLPPNQQRQSTEGRQKSLKKETQAEHQPAFGCSLRTPDELTNTLLRDTVSATG